MATNNVNKLVRGNINLKPWILNKSPTDIVNSYVQQLYKQVPEKFKKDLFKPRNNLTPQPEKRAPSRFTFPIIKQPQKSPRPSFYQTPQPTIGNKFLPAEKKFLKSPNYKIYGSRKYSSASSSGVSYIRDSEERRKKSYKPSKNIQVRTYSSNSYTPVRVFNAVTKQMKCLQITDAICKDLMSVDKHLKEKIRPVKPTRMRQDTTQMSKQDSLDALFRGWNHPNLTLLNRVDLQSSSNRLMSTKSIFEEQSTAPKMMQVSKQRIGVALEQNLYASSLLPRIHRKENARFEVAIGTRYYERRYTSATPGRQESLSETNEKLSESRYSETRRSSARPVKEESTAELNERVNESRYYSTKPDSARLHKKASLTELSEEVAEPRYYETRPASARPVRNKIITELNGRVKPDSARPVRKESITELNARENESRYYETKPASSRPHKKESLTELSEEVAEPRYYETRPASARPVRNKIITEVNGRVKPNSARPVRKESITELNARENESRYYETKPASARPHKKESLTELTEEVTEPRYYETRPARPIKKESISKSNENAGESWKQPNYGEHQADLVCRSRSQRGTRPSTTHSIPRRIAALQSIRRT